MLRVVNVVGTRPNLVKMSAVLAAQRARPGAFTPLLVHTGQHRDPLMSDRFFADLELPPPDLVLNGGAAAPLSVEAMREQLVKALERLRPDLVLVVGDVNSTAAAALAARALAIPLAHVEAGLRSFDPTMPEERNRILVDRISDYLFASEESGASNLLSEGRPAGIIHHVGNVMIDALVRFRERAGDRRPARALGLATPYGVLTLHRPATVDHPHVLAPLLRVLGEVARRLPIVFPVHPRTRDRLAAAGLTAALADHANVHTVPPLGYLDMLALLEQASLVLTDSGGVQEETTYLGVPCLTLRDATERPATVEYGTHRVVGTDPEHVRAAIERLLAGDLPPRRLPPLWDGRAAERIAAILAAGDSASPR